MEWDKQLIAISWLMAYMAEKWLKTKPLESLMKKTQGRSGRVFVKKVEWVEVMAALVSVALEVGAAAVASPTGVLELDTHSSSEADPSESSPPPIFVAPMVLPFLCSNDLESDTKMPERHVSPTTSTLEIPTPLIPLAPSAVVAPSSEFPLAPVVSLLVIRRQRASLIRPRQNIPIGRLYCTHPGGPCRALTVRKPVRPLPSHRLALRHASLDTTVADSSTPPRFIYPPLAKTSRCSEAYLR
ncbi:hypothetical protein Tco_0531495 [Tanacetum coccineum]